MSRYGSAIERDLACEYPGTDLATEFRSRRWRKLLNLIEGLPSDSALAEAQAADEELAELAPTSGDAPSSGPRITEFGPEVRALWALFDRVGEVVQAVCAAGQLKVPELARAPWPKTAAELVEKRNLDAQFNALVAEIEAARGRGSVEPVPADLGADDLEGGAVLGPSGDGVGDGEDMEA